MFKSMFKVIIPAALVLGVITTGSAALADGPTPATNRTPQTNLMIHKQLSQYAARAASSIVNIRRADLIIRDWWVVSQEYPSSPKNVVKAGKPYKVCFTVQNIGTAPATGFVTRGGGLGIPFNPTTPPYAGSLAAGATMSGCLYYPTTPAPGLYNLGLTVDATNVVAELNEGNNSRVETIAVAP